MEDYPFTTNEFERRFSSEKACRDYLFHLRWPDGFQCPRCENNKAWLNNRLFYQCSKCNYQVSVIAGTIFQGTHKPLQIWFKTIWWLTGQKNGASALGLARMLGIGSYPTAWAMLHKLRRAMVTPGRNLLSGIIEADETYIGGDKPGKRGRGAAGKALVFIGVEINESHIGRIRLQRIPNASAPSLENAIEKNVSRGSIIQTDGWSGYMHLNSIGYKHEVVRKEADIGSNLLPSCHRVVSLLKRWLLGTHQGAVSHKHLEYYLDEFTFRFNRRTSKHRGKLFMRLLENAVKIDPVTISKIINNESKNK
jgi:transposase-like protein